MKTHGYSKKGSNFAKQSTECGSALGIRSSRWNSPDYAEFGIEVGVYFPEITRKSIDMLGRNHKLVDTLTTVNRCTWTEDIGFLTERKIQSSWEVCQKHNPEQADKEVKKLVEEIGLPWMEQNSNLESFLEWLAVKGTRGAGEILWSFGREKEAHSCFSEHLADSGFPWDEVYPNAFVKWVHEYSSNDS